MSDAPKLTARQQQILHLIERRLERDGAPPTRVEIAEFFGFKSPNAAEEHLRALARKGVIELRSGAARGIRLARSSSADDASAPAMLTLPIIGRVAAGAPILAQECVERTWRVDPAMFSPRPDYLLRVRGLSMSGCGILDGDLLAVRRTCEALNGQIVVARIAGDVTVKRFRRTRAGIELHPEHPDFRPIIVDGSEDFAIEGLVVGLLRCGGV